MPDTLTHEQKVQFVRDARAGTPSKAMSAKYNTLIRDTIRTYAGYARRNNWPKPYGGWQRAQAEASVALPDVASEFAPTTETWSSTLAAREPSVGLLRRMWRFLW